MGLDFTVTISEKKVKEKWAEQVSTKDWIEMYQKHSNQWSSWDVDLKLAEFIVERVKTGYIDKYRNGDIPKVLRPLLLSSISDNIERQNEENEKITLNDVSGKAELQAILLLRKYATIDYDDAINIYCDGYQRGADSIDGQVDISNISSKILIEELKNRL